MTVARSAAEAFRSLIIEENNIRSAQYLMRGALALSSHESALVLDPTLKALYTMPDGEAGSCTPAERFCWGPHFQHVTTLFPIYYGKEGGPLFGYIQITLEPQIDQRLITLFLVVILASFFIQAFGLSRGLKQSAALVTSPLDTWASLLRQSPSSNPSRAVMAPYQEMLPMEEAIGALRDEIARLESESAARAKNAAQLSILTEIGHDLKTPLSQLSKAFELHLDTVRMQGQVDEVEVADVKRGLRQMGDLLRQVRMLNTAENVEPLGKCATDLVAETHLLLGDLKRDPEALDKEVGITLEVNAPDGPISLAQVSKIGYFRILENIIRNSVHAVPQGIGQIRVTLKNSGDGRAMLSVRDNGCGIAPENQSKVFDFDYTTKPLRGTGLGLGIVRRICTDIQADIRLKSVLNAGTEITVIFPREGALPNESRLTEAGLIATPSSSAQVSEVQP